MSPRTLPVTPVDADNVEFVEYLYERYLRQPVLIEDVVRGPMLAQKAAEEGVMVVERIAG
ncbi:MAG: hypothetical protein JW751_06895 [Polyangiaceae bacterium]|nr:hypothetical protein [Polyangiaceae bacterium]